MSTSPKSKLMEIETLALAWKARASSDRRFCESIKDEDIKQNILDAAADHEHYADLVLDIITKE